MDKTVIFFDVDGVLLEWCKPFLQYLYDMNILESPYRDGPVRVSEFTGYDFKSEVFDKVRPNIYKYMKDFIDSEHWDNLSPLVPITTLEALKNCGYELRILSQVSNKKDRPRRVNQITRHFGAVFTDIHFTCHRTCKAKFVERFMKDNQCNVWLVDDKPETVAKVAEKARVNEKYASEFGLMFDEYPHLYSAGICNSGDNPYLLDEYWAMQDSAVPFQWFNDVGTFAAKMINMRYI